MDRKIYRLSFSQHSEMVGRCRKALKTTPCEAFLDIRTVVGPPSEAFLSIGQWGVLYKGIKDDTL